MITEILYLSVEQMKRMKPSLDTIVVSILDLSEAHLRPRLTNFRSVLELKFEDTYEELKLGPEGGWPVEPTDEQHALYCQSRGERIPTLTDAATILAFIKKHHASDEKLKLVTHCHMGISRSGAVATWVANRFYIPIGNQMVPGSPNPRLLRLLDLADDRK